GGGDVVPPRRRRRREAVPRAPRRGRSARRHRRAVPQARDRAHARTWLRRAAMWQPSERIMHALPEARWPSADEAAASRLFSPILIGTARAQERTWVPAMVPWRATD